MKTYLSKVKMSFKTDWKAYKTSLEANKIDWKTDRKAYLKAYFKIYLFTVILAGIGSYLLDLYVINTSYHLNFTLITSISTSWLFIKYPRNNNLSKKLIFSGIIIIFLLSYLLNYFF